MRQLAQVGPQAPPALRYASRARGAALRAGPSRGLPGQAHHDQGGASSYCRQGISSECRLTTSGILNVWRLCCSGPMAASSCCSVMVNIASSSTRRRAVCSMAPFVSATRYQGSGTSRRKRSPCGASRCSAASDGFRAGSSRRNVAPAAGRWRFRRMTGSGPAPAIAMSRRRSSVRSGRSDYLRLRVQRLIRAADKLVKGHKNEFQDQTALPWCAAATAISGMSRKQEGAGGFWEAAVGGERAVAVFVTGRGGEREALAGPSRRSAMSRSATRARPGPDRANLYQEITDKIIAELEAGARALGPALGQAECLHRAGPSAERGDQAPLFRDQRPHPLERGDRARLLASELAHLSPGARARRPCPQGLDRHDRRLRRPLRAGRGAPPGRTRRRRAGGDPLPEALHGVQHRPVRGSAGGTLDHAAAPGRGPDPAAGRGADRRDRCGFPHRRRARLLQPLARFHPGASARRLFRADQLAPHGAARARPLERPSLPARP